MGTQKDRTCEHGNIVGDGFGCTECQESTMLTHADRELREELESLREWKRLHDDAPGEARDALLERMRESGALQPIIKEWRRVNVQLRAQATVDAQDLEICKQTISQLETEAKARKQFIGKLSWQLELPKASHSAAVDYFAAITKLQTEVARLQSKITLITAPPESTGHLIIGLEALVALVSRERDDIKATLEAKLEAALAATHSCASCGKPIAKECATCKRLWES